MTIGAMAEPKKEIFNNIDDSRMVSGDRLQSNESTLPVKLQLSSPVGAEPFEFNWPLEDSGNESKKASRCNVNCNGIGPHEIIDTIKLVSLEFPDLKLALEKNVLADYDYSSLEKMKQICDRYNRIIKESHKMSKGTSIRTESRSSTELVNHILVMSYNESVFQPRKLNKYPPFSPQVYGETRFEFVQQMIEEIGIEKEDVFIDLGSGIGQVVMHVAAAFNCSRVIGIEKAEVPTSYSETFKEKFLFWLKWYGKKYTKFEFYYGDFFNEKFKDMICSANIIFVNNYAFGPEVDLRLKTLFENLKDGTKILSSKPFCSLKFQISERNMGDIGAMMEVREISPNEDQSVSWTSKAISYFLHIINRTKLAIYFEKCHDRQKKKENRRRGPINHDDSSNDHSNKNGNSIPSKWTRKAWSEYINNKSITTNGHSNQNDNINSISNNLISTNNEQCNTNSSDANRKRTRGRPKKSSDRMDNLTNDECSLTDILNDNASLKNESNDDTIIDDGNSLLSSRRGRPKKANVIHKKKKKIYSKKKVKGINLSNLNVLHEQTLLSTTSLALAYTAPPPGCVEQRLCSKGDENTVSVPNITIVNKDIINEEIVSPAVLSPHSDTTKQEKTIDEFKGMKLCKPNNIRDLILLFYHQIYSFDNLMKNESFISQLKQLVAQWELSNDEEKYKINALNREIYEYKYNVIKDLKELNIQSTQDLIKKIEDCQDELNRLNTQIEELKQSIDGQKEELQTLFDKAKVEHEKIQIENKKMKEIISKQNLIHTNAKSLDNINLPNTNSMNLNKNPVAPNIPNTNSNSELPVPSESLENNGAVMGSPKINYKEMKYKKYVSRKNFMVNNSDSNSNSTIESNGSKSSTPTPSSSVDLGDGVNSSDAIKIDVNRINSAIVKGFNEENKESKIKRSSSSSPASSSVSTNQNYSGNTNSQITNGNISTSSSEQYKPSSTKRTRNKKENKIETLKTKKGDREIIMTAGCITTVVNRKNDSINNDSKNDSNANSNGKLLTKSASAEKPFPFKLKINCKESKVKIMNETELTGNVKNETVATPPVNSGSSKRKSNDSNSSSNKKVKSETKNKNGNSAKNGESNSSKEMKRPQIVIKFGSNNGQYYSRTLDDDDSSKNKLKNAQSDVNKTTQLQSSSSTISATEIIPSNNFNTNDTTSVQNKTDLNTKSLSSSSFNRSSSTESSETSSLRKFRKRCSKASQKSNTNKNDVPYSFSNDKLNQLYNPPSNTTTNLYSSQTNTTINNQSLFTNEKSVPASTKPSSVPVPTTGQDSNFKNYPDALNLINQGNYLENGLGPNFNPNNLFQNSPLFQNMKGNFKNIYNKDFYNFKATNQFDNKKLETAEQFIRQYGSASALMSQNGFDYSSINYDNHSETVDYLANAHLSQNNLDSLIKTKNGQQINNSHRPFYNI